MSIKVLPHQAKALNKFRTGENTALFYPMGTGKTLPTLLYIKEYLEGNPEATVLVVSQKFVAGVSWPQEIEKWTSLKYINLVGKTKAYRAKHIGERAGKITLCSFGTLKPIGNLGKKYQKWDLIIVDEASLVKDTKTLRHRCLKHMKHNQIILLTGTPTPNGWHEVYGLVSLLGKKADLGGSKSNFLMNYFYPIRAGNIVVAYKPLNRSVAGRIQKLIGGYCLTADKPTVPVQYQNLMVDLSSSTMRQYKELETEYALEIKDSFVLAANKAVLVHKLRQLTSGCLFDINGKTHLVQKEKQSVLREFLERTEENVIVWYSFLEGRRAIVSTCEELNLTYTTTDVEGWNMGKYRVFVGHPQSFGYGMNMQEGGRVILWYDLVFSSSQYDQANARIARKGQSRDCIIYHLICRNTVDEKVLLCLKKKRTDQDFFLSLFKENEGIMWEIKKLKAKSGYLFPGALKVEEAKTTMNYLRIFKAFYLDSFELVINQDDYWFIVSMEGKSELALKAFDTELRRLQDEYRATNN